MMRREFIEETLLAKEERENNKKRRVLSLDNKLIGIKSRRSLAKVGFQQFIFV
jgi:hypothetical protein